MKRATDAAGVGGAGGRRQELPASHERRPPTVVSAFRRKETVDDWLTRYGQRGRLREWLWEPLAVAALNQSPREASAEPFVTVLAEMFGPSRVRFVAGAAAQAAA